MLIIKFFILLTFLTTQIFSQCIDYFDAFDHEGRRNVPCPTVTDDPSKYSKRGYGSMFQIKTFECNITQEICDKVKNSFLEAGDIVAKNFVITTPLNVNISYVDLCTTEPAGLCNAKTMVIGAARPTRDMPMLDDDGVIRYYPQPLVKQFQLETHPEFGSYDIIVSFNSEFKNWYFQSSTPIQPKQFDIRVSFVHELMHSFGFNSNWRNWIVTDVINDTLITTRPILNETNTSVVFNGFGESAFDRYIKFSDDNKKLTPFNLKLNEFSKSGKTYKNESDLIIAFLHSDQVNIAKYMNNITTTPKSLYIQPDRCCQSKLFLETSVSPYRNGVSVSHFDQSYINTSDFLMTTLQIPGKTLYEQSGGKSPFGPTLQGIMECIGFTTGKNPRPYRPKMVSLP